MQRTLTTTHHTHNKKPRPRQLYDDHEGTRTLIWVPHGSTFFELFVSRPHEVMFPPARGDMHFGNVTHTHTHTPMWTLHMDHSLKKAQEFERGWAPIRIGDVSEAECRRIVDTMFAVQW
jgi:hypothetical protein